MQRIFIVIAVFTLLFTKIVASQEFFLDPSKDINLFKPSVLKNLKVKRAVVFVSFKYDLDIIQPTNETIVYEFDEDGFLSRSLEINPFRHRRDTIEIIYFRNATKEIITEVKHDPTYTYVQLYNYSQGNTGKIESYQMRKTKQWNASLYPDKLMWSDSMAFNEKELAVYNQFGTVYKKFKFEKNKDTLVSEIKRYDRGGKWVSTIELDYADGKLSEINTTHANKLMFNSQKKLQYNNSGLIQETYLKDGTLEYVRKITYNKVGLPELDISRNEKSKKMTIKKIVWE